MATQLGKNISKKRHQNRPVHLLAMYAEMESSLHKIRNWKIGDTIDLNIMEDHPATLFCDDIPMFEGAIGKTRST